MYVVTVAFLPLPHQCLQFQFFWYLTQLCPPQAMIDCLIPNCFCPRPTPVYPFLLSKLRRAWFGAPPLCQNCQQFLNYSTTLIERLSHARHWLPMVTNVALKWSPDFKLVFCKTLTYPSWFTPFQNPPTLHSRHICCPLFPSHSLYISTFRRTLTEKLTCIALDTFDPLSHLLSMHYLQ